MQLYCRTCARSNEQIVLLVKIYMHLTSRTFCFSDSWIKKIWWSRTISLTPHSDDENFLVLKSNSRTSTQKSIVIFAAQRCATKKQAVSDLRKVPLLRFALFFTLPQGTPKFEHVFPKCTMLFKEQKSTSIFAARRSVAKKQGVFKVRNVSVVDLSRSLLFKERRVKKHAVSLFTQAGK